MHKKGSLEISIQAIVIVVLAMTLLGLGLGFIKGMFSDISGLSRATFDKIQDQLQRDLTNSNEKLIFSQTKINIERGKSTLLGWGIRNDGNTKLDYWAEFTAVKCPKNNCPSLRDLNDKWFTFKYNPGGTKSGLLYDVDAAEQQVVRVDLSVPKDNTETGLYLIDLSIYDAATNQKYASTDLFVTVT